MSIIVTGLNDVVRKLQGRIPSAAERALGEALYEEGQSVLRRSKRLVPVDTGRLRAAGYVDPPNRVNGEIGVDVGYGTDYAMHVHERTEINHVVGQAKYLEAAISPDGFHGRVAKRVRAKIEGFTVVK